MKEQSNTVVGKGSVHFNARSFALLKKLYYAEFDDLESVQFEWLIDFLIGQECDWMLAPEWNEMYLVFESIKKQYLQQLRDNKIDLILNNN